MYCLYTNGTRTRRLLHSYCRLNGLHQLYTGFALTTSQLSGGGSYQQLSVPRGVGVESTGVKSTGVESTGMESIGSMESTGARRVVGADCRTDCHSCCADCWRRLLAPTVAQTVARTSGGQVAGSHRSRRACSLVGSPPA